MAGHIPGPELDHMAVGVGYVGRAAAAVAELDELDGLAPLFEMFDESVELDLGEVKGEVDVHAAALAGQGRHRRQPQPDPRAFTGHYPDRIGPALDNGQAEGPGIEGLGALELGDGERELADA